MNIRQRFLKLAYEQLNPDVGTLEGLEQALSNWYCFQYNVPPNDDKLMDMTLEELFVLFQMHKLRENPALADDIDTNRSDSYETWLKKQMGEDYVSEEDMVKKAVKLEEDEKKFVEDNKEKYPDQVQTDFSKVGK